MKNIKMQHINYILGLNIKDVEKLELIKCYLEAGDTEQKITYGMGGWTTPNNSMPLNNITHSNLPIESTYCKTGTNSVN